MNVMIGWSGETASGVWRKIDVSLDETDLHRILNDWGLDVEPKSMKSAHVFLVLENEAETYLCAKLTSFGVSEGIADKMNVLAKSKQNLKETIRGRSQGTE